MADLARGLQPPQVGDSSFDAYYYAHCCGDPYTRSEPLLKFFGGVASRIVSDMAPATVLDAGCAIGMLVEALRARGVDASGIDLSSYAIGEVDPSVRAYCHHGSIADEFPRRYDLIVSIEVVEHMPVRAAEDAIANFCRHTDDVLFSSSPLDYKEPTHINVHPPEYWAEEFARHGFYRDVDYDGSYITPWAARFRRSGEPLHRVVRNYERRFWNLAIERNDTRTYAMEMQQKLAVELERTALLQREAETARAAADAADRAAAVTREELAQARSDAETARAAAASARTDGEQVRTAATAKCDDIERRLRQTEIELAQARDRMFHMERSAFWRARGWWKRLTGSS